VNTLCIVPCGSKKIWGKRPQAGPTPARNVYTGPFAGKCREYAETFHPASWCILSAKYGFLFPDEVVPGPYEVTFNDRETCPISEVQLASQADSKGLGRYDRIVVLGGRNYVGLVREVFRGKAICTPLSDCRGIGYMMGKLNEAIRVGRPI